MGLIIDLAAITGGHLRGNSPAFQVMDEPRITQRPDTLDLDSRRLRRNVPWRIGRNADCGRPFEAPKCHSEVAVLQGHDQIDDAASASQPVVVSQVMDIIDAEARRTLFT